MAQLCVIFIGAGQWSWISDSILVGNLSVVHLIQTKKNFVNATESSVMSTNEGKSFLMDRYLDELKRLEEERKSKGERETP